MVILLPSDPNPMTLFPCDTIILMLMSYDSLPTSYLQIMEDE